MRWLMPRTQCRAWHMAAFGECSFLLLSLLTLAQVPPFGSPQLCHHLGCSQLLQIGTWLTAGELGAHPLSNSHIFILPSLEMSLVRLAPGWGQHPSRPLGTSSASSPSTDTHLQADGCSFALPQASLMNDEEALRPQPAPSWLPASDIFDLRWHNFSPKCECICELIENSSRSGDIIQGCLILAAILIVT